MTDKTQSDDNELKTAGDIVTVDTDDIIPYANNPKEHPDEQVNKISSSIKNYEYDQQIVIDEEGEIVKGHGRLMAAKKLGYERIEVRQRSYESEAEKKAARIADNKTAEAPWDEDLLSLELEQVEDDFDAEALGFEEDGLDELLSGDDGPGIGDAEPLGLEEEYEVIVEVESEQEQEQVYEELIEEGYECRLNSM